MTNYKEKPLKQNAVSWLMNDQCMIKLKSLSREDRRRELDAHEADYIIFFSNVIGFAREDDEAHHDIRWDHAFKKRFPDWSQEQQNHYLAEKYVDKLKKLPTFPENIRLKTVLKILLGEQGYRANVRDSNQNTEKKYHCSYDLEKLPSSSPTPEESCLSNNIFLDLCRFLSNEVCQVLDSMVHSTKCPEMRYLWLSKTLRARQQRFKPLIKELKHSLPSDFLDFDQKSVLEKALFQDNRSRRSKGGDIACLRFNARSFQSRVNIEFSGQADQVIRILLSVCSNKSPYKPVAIKFDKKSDIHKEEFLEIVKMSFSGCDRNNCFDSILHSLYKCTGKGALKVLPKGLIDRIDEPCSVYWAKDNKRGYHENNQAGR